MKKNAKKRKGINNAPTRCPYCGGTVIYRSADGIYKDNSRNTMLYVCAHTIQTATRMSELIQVQEFLSVLWQIMNSELSGRRLISILTGFTNPV